MANCTFISPRTFSARASSSVCRSISATISGFSECGGSEQAESPECTPASSICSITPADEDVLAVGDGVDVDFDGVAEIGVDQHRALARHHHGLRM